MEQEPKSDRGSIAFVACLVLVLGAYAQGYYANKRRALADVLERPVSIWEALDPRMPNPYNEYGELDPANCSIALERDRAAIPR